MSTWQLIAHPDPAVCEAAASSVRRALKRRKVIATIDSVNNIADAVASLDENGLARVDLVVIASSMPADDTTPVGASGREPTKAFIKQLKKNRSDLPVIVLSSTADERIAGFLDAYEQTGLVELKNEFGVELADRVCDLRADGAVAASDVPGNVKASNRGDSFIHLDIHLGGQQYGGWQMKRVGVDAFEAQGTLQVDRHQLQRFIKDSKRLNDAVAHDDAAWYELLKDLSNDLHDLLFQSGRDNRNFWTRFLIHRTGVGGVEHSRVRVTVDEATHAMLFEALRDGDVDDEFWVLNAPVFRRYAHQLALPPLFKGTPPATGDTTINCLIIDADPSSGYIAQWGDDGAFEKLHHLADEAGSIVGILDSCDGVDAQRLSLADVDGNLPDTVLTKLRERQWHIVHFCGHVGGDPRDASLVLRADAAGLLKVSTLVGALSRTQLLFLSSCRSAATRIVMHAVEQLVPAVIGFQWVINDRDAADFARDFYRQLLHGTDARARDLEYALLHARREAYKRQPERPSWVAPVLVMQMG